MAEKYLAPFREEGIGALVLGCTHYPLLRPAIGQVLPGVDLVDSAQATADVVEAQLEKLGLLRTTGAAQHRTYVTDLPKSFHQVAERFLGRPVTHIEQVDIAV